MVKTKYTVTYRQLVFRRETTYSKQDINNKFGGDCKIEWLKKDFAIGFKDNYIEELVEYILNLGWEIASVSEDERRIAYHFINKKEIKSKRHLNH